MIKPFRIIVCLHSALIDQPVVNDYLLFYIYLTKGSCESGQCLVCLYLHLVLKDL